MIPRNQQNRKLRVDLHCPTCGMDLTDPATRGFTRDGETYCCEGCATGTGCTCARPSLRPRNPRRIGAIEQREPGGGLAGLPKAASPSNGAGASSEKAAGPRRYPTRKAGTKPVPKRKRNVTKERDSTREQSRGRSEFTGQLNKKGAKRVAITGTKSTR